MQIMNCEPENNLVVVLTDDGQEARMDYTAFERNFTVCTDGVTVEPSMVYLPEVQRESMALAVAIVQRSYIPVFPADPRPVELCERVVSSDEITMMMLSSARNVAVSMASAVTDLCRNIKTPEYTQAARAAWCLADALDPDFSRSRFDRFYRSYLESMQ